MSRKLYVGNLPLATTESDLRRLFERFGEVDRVSLVNDRETGLPRGFAFVEMAELGAADSAALDLQGHRIGGRALRVAEASDRTAVDSGSGRSL